MPPARCSPRSTTMWDVLSWGGETQALIYHPELKKVIGINALGVAPTGATTEYYRSKGTATRPSTVRSPPSPRHAGGLLTMLAEYGTLSLADVLAPAIQMADGYPIEAQTANAIEQDKAEIKQWRYSRAGLLPHPGEAREAPEPGEIFRQPDLAATLRKLVEAEQTALKRGRAARTRSTPPTTGSIGATSRRELVRGAREEGGLITLEDLAGGRCGSRSRSARPTGESRSTSFPSGSRARRCSRRSTSWSRRISRRWATTRPQYIHTLYQAMSLAFADRDFYYGDPYFPPEEPVKGSCRRTTRRRDTRQINWERNDPDREARRSLSLPGRDQSVRRAARALDGSRPRAGYAPSADAASATRPSVLSSTPAPPRSRPRTRRAGWSR